MAKPQEPGVFTVSVVDAAGAPVSAQVSLGVIDEAVYAIRQDDTPDPVRFFYRREYSRVGTAFSRDYYFTGFSGSERLQLAARKRRPFTLADFKGDKEVQPQVRKEFPDAIYWIGDLVTDAQGQAKVSIKYPDALTTWRLTARAVTRDTKAGVAGRAHDDDEGSDRARDHAALPDRRRSGRAAHDRAQLSAGREGHHRRVRGDGPASRSWRVAVSDRGRHRRAAASAATTGASRATTVGTRGRDGDGAHRCRQRRGRTADSRAAVRAAARGGRERLAHRPMARHDTEVTHSRGVESGGAHASRCRSRRRWPGRCSARSTF